MNKGGGEIRQGLGRNEERNKEVDKENVTQQKICCCSLYNNIFSVKNVNNTDKNRCVAAGKEYPIRISSGTALLILNR